MTDYVNNYLEPVTLALGATTLDLSLPDGDYLLTLTDSQTAPTRWEIVQAVVVSGTATLTRAQEGTTDQLWSSGSVIYCALTAGAIGAMGGGSADTGWLDVPAEAGIGYVPQYRKLNGVVHLRGFVYVNSSDMGDYLGTLPEDCRPSATMFKDVEVNDARRYRINVFTDGGISVSVQFNGTSDYFTFDFISFPAG